MKTIVYEPTEENIIKCAEIIQRGGLVAFPTETVYGLGADAFNEEASKSVYTAKGRPSDNPLIVHISRASDIGQLTPMLSQDIVTLIDNFWPGPLTLVVKKKDNISDVVSGGLDTVAVRLPDNEATRDLINRAGTPLVGPSANTSGRPSPTKAEHVLHDLDGRIDAIIDGGTCRVGIESTVLDMTGDTPTILRPGLVTKENLEAALGKPVALDPTLTAGKPTDEDFKPKAPGMKYKHYAPKADMLIVEGNRIDVGNEVERLRRLNEKLGNKVGVLLFEEKTFNEAAHEFFSDLRDMDEQGVDMIIAGALSDTDGVGFAVMNRMLKSAGYNIVRV
jgi:L-threonylcarbamoyladenylate synthase